MRPMQVVKTSMSGFKMFETKDMGNAALGEAIYRAGAFASRQISDQDKCLAACGIGASSFVQ